MPDGITMHVVRVLGRGVVNQLKGFKTGKSNIVFKKVGGVRFGNYRLVTLVA